MVETYRFFADCGANAIIGHHTHCPSGYEIYNDVPIFYSLGNFLFDWRNRPDTWYKGYLVSLVVRKNKKISFELIPYKQCEYETKLEFLSNEEKKEFQKKIVSINAVICNREKLLSEFEKFSSFKKNYILDSFSAVNFFSNRHLKAIIKRLKLSNLFYNKKQLNTIFNLMRCESHHELVLNVLKKYFD